MVHTLDDFFLILGPLQSDICEMGLNIFIKMCGILGVPIKKEKKTQHASAVITFLGIELDSIRMEARLLKNKVIKIRGILENFMKKRRVKLRITILRWTVKLCIFSSKN